MEVKAAFSLSLTVVLNTQAEHLELSLQRWQTRVLSTIAGMRRTMRVKAAPIVVPIAHARRRREITEKSDKGGVYMMCIPPDRK
jgi:hypothetical protein